MLLEQLMSKTMATVSAPLSFKWHPAGKALSSSQKQTVLNVYIKLREKCPEDSDNSIVSQTSELTGIGQTSIRKLRSEFRTNACFSTPGKKRPRAAGRRTRLQKYDEFTRSSIRRIVHGFYHRNEIPTVKKVSYALKTDEDLPSLSLTATRNLMNALGFVFAKRKRESLLIERDDIVLWRRRYLRAIKHFRLQNRTSYWLDETWVNAGHTKTSVWQDKTVKSKRQAFSEGLSTGLKAPSGKGKRLIVLHAGNEDGFVPNAELIFTGKKSGDYHEEMDGERFKKWFTDQLLPNIKPNSVIIMDNASYHSVKLEKIPTSSSRKNVMQDWLTEKGIPWNADMLRRELYALIASVKNKYEKYVIDEIAALNGHTVLRLPPYHCELNPIEKVWSYVKGFVAAENRSFNLHEVKDLVSKVFTLVTKDKWNNFVDHIKKEENRMWEIDCLTDNIVDTVQFTVNCSSDDERSENDAVEDEMSGVEELV